MHMRAGRAINGSLLGLEPQAFREYFDRRPFKITHSLCDHPLLQIPRLIELARSLGRPVLYFRGDLAVNQADARAGAQQTFMDRNLARPDLSPVEVLSQIESCGAWMQLRDVATDPEYAALVRQLIDEFRGPAEQVAAGLSDPRADIFVSSPGSTTPFHLDEEHNFLLQIRGSKHLSIADGFDPAVLSPAHLRAYFQGRGELAPYTSHLEESAVHVQLAAGEGVHIPPCHPHWVQNGGEVSVSLGILWYSDVTARRRYLYRFNNWLESKGIRPKPPGDSFVRDSIKSLPLMLKRRLHRLSIGAKRFARRLPE